MKRKFTSLVGYLVGCFCILQLSANAAQIQFFLNGKESVRHFGISLPSSKNHSAHFTALQIAISATNDDFQPEFSREDQSGTFFTSSLVIVGQCQLSTLRLKTQRQHSLKRSVPPLFVLHHSWKSYIV